MHAAWLPPDALRAVGCCPAQVSGPGPLVQTIVDELHAARARFGGDDAGPARLVLTVSPAEAAHLGPEGYTLGRTGGVATVSAGTPEGLWHGFWHVVRLGEAAFGDDAAPTVFRPAHARRMLDHWDNVDRHGQLGQVERGYSGDSIFWKDGVALRDEARVRAYARLIAATGINAVALNNVNVRGSAARLLTDRLDEVVWLADMFRPYGIRVHLSVSFAAPVRVGGLSTGDPLDPAVVAWWAATTANVYAAIPDFGGYLVKADSEGEPGPFGYGRTHADGANVLADALAPYGGVVHWRAFVYNHRQDWRDRSTDRARAAYDHFAPLDGQFRGNVILQVKYGPIDFQTREPISPVIAAMPQTRVASELQVTQEYTGQQRHACYLAPQWSEILSFPLAPATVSQLSTGGVVAVSNVGNDEFWTGHPLAQANLYAFGRLAWDPSLTPSTLLNEWTSLTFPDAPESLRGTLHALMDDSWHTYESYTAPLGVGFMVKPHYHYGPDVDGYEYSPWGTYHFADRNGVGVDRTRATGTGYTGQYPAPWCDVYEDLATCPDELLLFFHHVPYAHVLHSGKTVIQHIYDTHFEGVEKVRALGPLWAQVAGTVAPDLHARVAERLDEQLRCAVEWRDQINTYFYRKSGIPDANGRTIFA
jgi:alpha-glucuronidase